MRLTRLAVAPAIGLGTFGSDNYTTEQIAEAVIGAASVGYRHFDCASVYGNEDAVGRSLQTIIQGGIPREDLVFEVDGATSNFTWTLFNLTHGRLVRTWGDLVDAVGGADTTWLTDLDQHFVAALHEELFSPSTSMIQLWDTWRLHRRSYRAILYQIVREGRHRLDAGASSATLGRPQHVPIVLDPVSDP